MHPSVSVKGPKGSGAESFLESLEGLLENAPSGDSLVLPGDVSAHLGSDSEIWRGVVGKNGPPRYEPKRCSVAGLLCSELWCGRVGCFEFFNDPSFSYLFSPFLYTH